MPSLIARHSIEENKTGDVPDYKFG